MQLRMITDYAIRVLLYLSAHPGYVVLDDVGEAMGISSASAKIAIRKLRDAGWVESKSGSDGGYRFCGNISTISMLDVMRVTEDTVCFNRCLEDDGFCSRDAVAYCPVHEAYVKYQRQTEDYFSAIKLSDL